MRTKLSYKPLIVAGSIVFVLSGIFTSVFFLGDSEVSMAASTGDYRSKQTGNWNAVVSWERYNGTSWVNTTSAPKSSDGEITIQNGHTITMPAAVTVDQLTIEAGATLISNHANFIISNGTGTDLTVNGTLILNNRIRFNSSSRMDVNGTVNKNSGDFIINSGARIDVHDGGTFIRSGGNMNVSSGFWYFHAGSTYRHSVNGSSLPAASWNVSSTCLLTGLTSSIPDNLDQDFGNLTFSSTGQTGNFKFNDDDDDELGDIDGNLTVTSTGSGSITLNKDSNKDITIGENYFHDGGTVYITEGEDCDMSIGGNLRVAAGTFAMTSSAGASGEGNPILNISGNLILDGGTFDMSRYTGSSSSKGRGTVNLSGDLLINSGILTETATNAGKGILNFAGTSTQQFVNNGTISNTIDFNVESNAKVDFGTYSLTGSGSFTSNTSSIMSFGSQNGITISEANGNIQVSGTRTFSQNAGYIYNGTIAQVTGNGLPSTVENLSFNNSAGVTLSNNSNVNSNLLLENGIVETGSYALTVGTSILNTGSLSRTNGWVNGNLARWIPLLVTGEIVFPVGVDTYNELSLTYSLTPSDPGLLTVNFVNTSPDQSGLPIFEANSYKVNTVGAKGYWTTSSSNGLTGGLATVSVLGNGFNGIPELSDVRLLARSGAVQPWLLLGEHSAGTGSLSSPIATRTGLGIPSLITIGWGYNALPIELIDFSAKADGNKVLLKWSTAAEINNEYFTLERSPNGIDFEAIGMLPGSGNTTSIRTYQYVDESPLSGEAFYRLRQTDYDGKFEVFDPKRVFLKRKALEESSLKVWPNPFEDRFELELQSESSGTLNITLLAMDGRSIMTESIQMNSSSVRWTFYDGNNLIPGTYILQLQCDEEVLSQKLIKR